MTLWTYRARPEGAVDGDTIRVVIDHGMNIHSRQNVRLLDVDAPELFSGTDRQAGAAARDAAQGWLDESPGVWPLLVTTVKDRRSFNRYLATVTRLSDGTNLADWLVEQGHATRSGR